MSLVVFLDFDGVLAIDPDAGYKAATLFRRSQGEFSGSEDRRSRLFAPTAVANIVAIHDEFRPAWVISSSLQRVFDRGQIVGILQRNGLGVVADHLHEHWRLPMTLSPQSRARGISNWLGRVRYEGRALVIDDQDSGSGLLDIPWSTMVVLCDPGRGFDGEALQQARRLLRGGN